MICEMCKKECNKQNEITIETTSDNMDIRYVYKLCDKCIKIILNLLKKPERLK